MESLQTLECVAVIRFSYVFIFYSLCPLKSLKFTLIVTQAQLYNYKDYAMIEISFSHKLRQVFISVLLI